MFNIEYGKYGDVTVATVHAAQVIDTSSMVEFGDTVLRFLEGRPDSHLMLNFTKVDYMSSALLTELLRINDFVRLHRGSMRLCGLRKEMLEVFKITKLDGLFTIAKDYKAGVKQYDKDVKQGNV